MTNLAAAHNLIRWVDRRALQRSVVSDENHGWVWVLPEGLDREILKLITTPTRDRELYAPIATETIHGMDGGAYSGWASAQGNLLEIGFEYEGPSDPPESQEMLSYIDRVPHPLLLIRTDRGDPPVWIFTARTAWVPMSFRFNQALREAGLNQRGRREHTITSVHMPSSSDIRNFHDAYYNKLLMQALRRTELPPYDHPEPPESDHLDVSDFPFPGLGVIRLGAIVWKDPLLWLNDEFTMSLHPDPLLTHLSSAESQGVPVAPSQLEFPHALYPMGIVADALLSIFGV